MNAHILSVLLALPLAAVPAEKPPIESGLGQVIIDSEGVESFVLQSEWDQSRGTTAPLLTKDSKFFAMPGRYRIYQMVIKGGYRYQAPLGGQGDWFTLTSEKPYHLQAPGPLSPHVEVTRHGRVLKLDYQLLDAAGRNYRAENTEPTSAAQPRFVIRQDGREIASGDFEYG